MNYQLEDREENPAMGGNRWRDEVNNSEKHPDRLPDRHQEKHPARHPERHRNGHPNIENILEDISNESTSSGTASAEEMPLELSDAKVRVESEELTSMADSTMKDGLGSADASDESVEIRCCVERLKAGLDLPASVCSSDLFRDVEQHSKVTIPSDTTIGNLVQIALRSLNYSETDLLGARGMIVIKNWKPMALESITDDPFIKVGDLLAGLSALVTLKIQLRYSFSKFRQIDDVKEKLLFFLLRNSKELLQTSGCPIIQTAFEETFGDKSNFPDDLRNMFDDWYKDQMSGRRIRPTGAQSFITNGHSPIREKPHRSERTEGLRSEAGAAPGRATLPAAKAIGRLWVGHDDERVRLRHRRKEGTSLRTDELRSSRHQTEDGRKESHFNSADISTAILRHTSLELNTTPSVAPRPMNTALKDERDADTRQESSAESDDEDRVPELPNKNAVYVIRPVPVSGSSLDSMEVILADSETDSNDLTLSPEPQDLSKTVSSSTAARDKEHDHSGETVTGKATVDHLPTNLSLREVSKSLPKVSREEEYIRKAGNVFDQFPSNRFGVFPSESPKRPKNSRCDDHSPNPRIQTSERCSPKLPQDIPSAFGLLQQTLHHHDQHRHHNAASHLLALSQTMNFMRHLHGPPLPIHQPLQDYSNDNTSDSDQKKRSRVFIDPISETPKLEEWFAVDSHPSTATIEELTGQLNRSIYRQRFPKLEPKNVQLWFKNHRAKVKRLKSEPTRNGRE